MLSHSSYLLLRLIETFQFVQCICYPTANKMVKWKYESYLKINIARSISYMHSIYSSNRNIEAALRSKLSKLQSFLKSPGNLLSERIHRQRRKIKGKGEYLRSLWHLINSIALCRSLKEVKRTHNPISDLCFSQVRLRNSKMNIDYQGIQIQFSY